MDRVIRDAKTGVDTGSPSCARKETVVSATLLSTRRSTTSV